MRKVMLLMKRAMLLVLKTINKRRRREGGSERTETNKDLEDREPRGVQKRNDM